MTGICAPRSVVATAGAEGAIAVGRLALAMIVLGRAALVLLALWPAVAAAHGPPRPTSEREIVRVVGHVREPAAAEAGATRMVLAVLGQDVTFAAAQWQTFGLASPEGGSTDRPARVTLQGARETLAKLVAARPEQRVAILAERRPGAAEIFLLALDLCPDR